MKITLNLALLACAVTVLPVAQAEESACYDASKAITKTVKASPNDVLAIVGREIAASPDCACEIVKAAIVATEADPALVGQIVAASIAAAPDKGQIIVTCAVAVAPDALSEIKKATAHLGGDFFKHLAGRSGNDPVDTGSAVENPVEDTYLVPGLPLIHPELISSTCTPDEFPNIDIIRSSSYSQP